MAAGSRDTIAVLTVIIGCPCPRPPLHRPHFASERGIDRMSHPWWMLALIALCDLGNERPAFRTRAACYTAAFLMVLAVVIQWL